MLKEILENHKLYCKDKGVIWEYTPVKIVADMFYDSRDVFQEELYTQIVKNAFIDKTQSMEERGALGTRYLVHVNVLRQLIK